MLYFKFILLFFLFIFTLLGKNYREHVAEIATKNSVDVTTAKENAAKSATFFTKAPECVIGMYIHQSQGSYTIIFLLFRDVHFLPTYNNRLISVHHLVYL